MKISIIYDSVYGNTEKIAQTIKEVLEEKNEVEMKRVTDAKLEDFQKNDLVIIGCPTHGGRSSKAVQVLLNSINNIIPLGLTFSEPLFSHIYLDPKNIPIARRTNEPRTRKKYLIGLFSIHLFN